MKLLDVYPLFDIGLVRANGSWLWDKNGKRYLDFYGGHGVISIGHSHSHYVQRLSRQLNEIAFYSNSVKIEQQETLAGKLGELSGYGNYNLFLCNSGAEANENALKMASFANGRRKLIAFYNSFHGRTSLALAVTWDEKIKAPVNYFEEVVFLPMNKEEQFRNEMDSTVCAVIIEGIQGVGGVHVPKSSFLKLVRETCTKTGAMMIMDEIQSGYGRTGKFFAHQYSGIRPDLITVAKGMGNGFPVAGVLISPGIEARHGMLGSTFGGSPLACVAALSVLEVIEKERLMENAAVAGKYLKKEFAQMAGVSEARGEGLMIGIDTRGRGREIRKKLLEEHRIFTGYSPVSETIRLLPPLSVSADEIGFFLEAFRKVLRECPEPELTTANTTA